MTVREQRQVERKERVIEAAMTLAVEGGYEAVQMRDVAARAEVAMGTIYRYFTSKDAMLVAGLCEWIDMVRNRIDAMGIEANNDADRLVLILSEAAKASTRNPVLMGAMFTALATTDPEVEPYKARVDQQVGELINSAFEEGSDADVAGITRVIGHVWFSSTMSWVSRNRPSNTVSDELAAAVRLLLPAAPV